MRLTIILLALPALAAASTGRTVDRWGVDEGLPNYALTSIIQTRDGYLWVASWARIVRFDGVRFTPVATDLPNVHARVLLEHPDGSIWIGATGEGLVRWRPDGARTFRPGDGLAGTDIRSLALDSKGRVWAASEGGVNIIDGSTVRTVGAAEGIRPDSPIGVTRGRDDRMWIATASGVCSMHIDDARCEPFAGHRGGATAIVEGRDDRLWIGTASGVREVGAGSPPGGACLPECLAGREVTTMAEGRDGLWVGFGDGAVAHIHDDHVTSYGAREGLPDAPVVALHEDEEGSLWIAIDGGGLVRFRPHRVATYTTDDGLPARGITSIVQDATGRVWAGSGCGPVAELVDGRFVPRFAEYTGSACALSVLATRDGSLWIGTRTGGLFRWDGRRMHHFDRSDGLSDATVSALFEDRDGVVWIGTEVGGVHRFADGQLSRAYGSQDGVATGYVVTFAQDRTGRVWIGSNANGLSIYENGRFTALGSHDGLPTGNIAGLIVDSRGDLWIGTAAHGLFRRRGDRYDAFGEAQGLGDSLVALMLEDRDANLWVSTTRGIVRLARERIEAVAAGREASLDPVILDRRDGLPHTEGSGGGFDPSGLRDRDGRLWFSTIGGIAVVDPASFWINQRPPPLAIEGVSLAGGTAVSADTSLHVPAGTSTIEIAYTAFSLLDPLKVRFRYRLVGLDDEWTDAGGRHAAYYTRLPPADYRFEVIAANNDGVWNATPATLHLVVAPFWWERASVRFAGLMVLLLATAFTARGIAARRARARLAELERAHALNRERERIARDLHDELGARLTKIALLADMPAIGGDRVATAARDAIATMGELVWSVNARHDTLDSFANYAAEFAQDHLETAGIRFRLDIRRDLEARSLAAVTRRQLFLAFKEAVNNAVKHAQASQVTVTIDLDGDVFVVEVADDGCGLPEAAEGLRLDGSRGNGMGNMRERMSAAGGTLAVESHPGRGTRLTFRLQVGR